jgi:DNA-binding PadR family transcriptional regulator
MIEFYTRDEGFGHTYTTCNITPKGVEWLLENQERFCLPNPPITEERLGYWITQRGIYVEKTPFGGMRRALRAGGCGRRPAQVVQRPG